MDGDPMTSRSCPRCGAGVADGAAICPACSTIVPTAAPAPAVTPRTVIRPGAPGTAPPTPTEGTGPGPQAVPASPRLPQVRHGRSVRHHRLPYLLGALAILVVAAIAAIALL